MRKPYLGPEITAGLATRCRGVSCGRLLPQLGRCLGSHGHTGNDGWHPSTGDGFRLWLSTSGLFNSSIRNTRATLSAKYLLSSVFKSLVLLPIAKFPQETGKPLSLFLERYNTGMTSLGYQWQKAPLQFEEGSYQICGWDYVLQSLRGALGSCSNFCSLCYRCVKRQETIKMFLRVLPSP